jgi:hypothetical protein
MDIDRVFIPTSIYCTFYSVAQWTFLKIDYILGHKKNLSKNLKIFPCILIKHNGIKLEITDKENCKIHSNWWRMNITFLNYQLVIEKLVNKLCNHSTWYECMYLKILSRLSKSKAKISCLAATATSSNDNNSWNVIFLLKSPVLGIWKVRLLYVGVGIGGRRFLYAFCKKCSLFYIL